MKTISFHKMGVIHSQFLNNYKSQIMTRWNYKDLDCIGYKFALAIFHFHENFGGTL